MTNAATRALRWRLRLRKHSDGADARDDHRDRGISLTEVLVSITLLGLTGTAVLGALATSAKGSATSRHQASSMLWLQSTADYVASNQVAYQACTQPDGTNLDAKSAYQSLIQTSLNSPASSAGWPKTRMAVQSVRYWDGTQFGTVCSNATNTIQEITLLTTEPNNRFSAQLVIVKGQS